jgi:hypothetical protein
MIGPVLATRPDSDLDSGSVLPDLRKLPITKLQLVKYAGASGDYNLIHTDDETARSVGLEGVIAHGMLSMAFLGEYLCWLAGPESVRRLSVRFNPDLPRTRQRSHRERRRKETSARGVDGESACRAGHGRRSGG